MAEATAAQIKKWKSTWGRVHCIEVEVDEKPLLNYFRHPDLQVILAASEFEDQPIRAGEIFYQNLKLQVDPEVEKDDEAKMGIYLQLIGLFKVKNATIKEL